MYRRMFNSMYFHFKKKFCGPICAAFSDHLLWSIFLHNVHSYTVEHEVILIEKQPGNEAILGTQKLFLHWLKGVYQKNPRVLPMYVYVFI